MEKKPRARAGEATVLKMVPSTAEKAKSRTLKSDTTKQPGISKKETDAAKTSSKTGRKNEDQIAALHRAQSIAIGWTTARKRAVVTQLQLLQPMLRLSDWTIKVVWDKASDESEDEYATNTPMGDSRHCEVRFSKRFLELDNKEMNQVIIHELMHCHLFQLEDYSVDSVEEIAPKRISALFNIGHTKLVETSIDAIADAFTELVPSFDFPFK
jgi:hypothetical protein